MKTIYSKETLFFRSNSNDFSEVEGDTAEVPESGLDFTEELPVFERFSGLDPVFASGLKLSVLSNESVVVPNAESSIFSLFSGEFSADEEELDLSPRFFFALLRIFFSENGFGFLGVELSETLNGDDFGVIPVLCGEVFGVIPNIEDFGEIPVSGFEFFEGLKLPSLPNFGGSVS